MSFGCFVDIYQQDGAPVRMCYEDTAVETVSFVKWVGINEQMAQKYRKDSTEGKLKWTRA